MVSWRQSASLILLAKKQANRIGGKSLFDYSTLLLKRSPKMRFAPDISAFPGGKLDPSDLSMDWPEYLSSSTNLDHFAMKTADIYKDIAHPYPGLVFRLCAIRETFEETGLLLAKSPSSPKSQYSTIQTVSESTVSHWREKIRHDGSQFLTMCKEMRVEPDIHSLTEWNQYLAAAIAKVRFDTIFYLALLPDTQPCSIADDDQESVSADWLDPSSAMSGYRQGSINFLPPQIYELCRLANFRQLVKLNDYLSKCRNDPEHRIERLLGVCYKIPEAMILVMPGDEHYPSDASPDTPILSSDRTLKDFDSSIQNRLVMMTKSANRKWQVHCRNNRTKNKDHLYIEPLSDGWENV